MAGVYIHIPFCKQACYYCDFHFSTAINKKEAMINAIAKELVLRRLELDDELVETIYFGGGTPSILTTSEINFLIQEVFKNYTVAKDAEITLEANPDDLSENRIVELSKTQINRLSIGVQSFFDDDLKMMNRAHNAQESQSCIKVAKQHFENISLDLIYGIPGMSIDRWKKNIEIAMSSGVTHISSYALTVEPKTVLDKLIRTGQIEPLDEDTAESHFRILTDTLKANHFIHYELSNFGKETYFSKNNSAYWLGKKYLGVGPSAHSFDGVSRSWNVANNPLYLKSIEANKLPSESEKLTLTEQYNEYIMTGLRTIWGVSLYHIEQKFGTKYLDYLNYQAQKFIAIDLLYIDDAVIKSSEKGIFLADGIASDLFYVD